MVVFIVSKEQDVWEMITVVIPVRNRERLIARAIDSVVAQTLPVDEIIVVDDASTDNTRGVVDGLANSLKKKLKLIALEENVGAAQARNIAIKAAKGDLIAFLDSDDVWYPDKLSKQAKEFDENTDVVAAFCGVVIVDPNTEYRHRYIPKPSITLNDLYHSSLLVTMSCALVRKKALLEIGGFDPSLPSCQDWDLFIRLRELGTLTVVQEELIEFWRHKGDRISRNKQRVLEGHEVVFGRIYGRISDSKLKRRVRASHEMRMADIFSTDCIEPSRAIWHSCRSLMLAPSSEGWWNFKSVTKSLIKNTVFRRAKIAC